MSQYVALRLRKLPIINWVACPDFPIKELQELIVKTQHGIEVAKALRITDKMLEVSEDENFVSEIIRAVDENDRQIIAKLRQKELDAFKKTKIKIAEHQLNMKLLKAEYLFDSSRVIFYFKSENKVDFRELLKSLASLFKTRIELRQIGVRDETRLLGGIGCCGKVVCCAQFMNTFYPVSTKMAKEQNLSLNPAKLSGICGRLLCCLAHEYEYYASFHGKFPKITSEIVVGQETARVMDINYLTRKILLGFTNRRKCYYDLNVVHGRKDPITGRNLWWIQFPDEPEPDLSLLLRNLNPPGSGKKKKKVTEEDSDLDISDNNLHPNSKAQDQMPNSEKAFEKLEKQRKLKDENEKLSDSTIKQNDS